jgi:TPR repeat protein
MILNRVFRLFYILSFLLLPYFCDSAFAVVEEKPSRITAEKVISNINSGQFKKAEAFFDKLVKEKPYSIDGTRLLEDVYYYIAEKRYIKSHLDKWCSASPSHYAPLILRGKYHIIDAWRERGGRWGYTVTDGMGESFRERLRLARVDLQKANSITPEDPNSAASMIQVCMGLGIDEDIMELWFQKAIEADPMTRGTYYYKLNFLNPKWRGTYEKFFGFAEYCYKNTPPTSSVYYIMIEAVLETLKRFPDVQAFLTNKNISTIINDVQNRMSTDFPKSTRMLNMLAYFEYKLEDYDKSLLYRNKVLEIDPDNRTALYSRGNLYMDKFNKLDKAKQDYKKILQIDDYFSGASFRLGSINKRRRNYREAIKYYNAAIKHYPFEPEYFLDRAIAKYFSGVGYEYESVIDDFNKAIELDHRYIDGYYYKGKYLIDKSEYKEARINFQIASQLIRQERKKGSSATIPQKELQSLTENINNYLKTCEQFEALYEKAKNGDPDAQYSIGQSHEHQGKILKALKWYQEASNKGQSDAQYRIAEIYSSGRGVQKNIIEAIKWYKKLAVNGHQRSQLKLGSIYRFKSGGVHDPAEALKWYKMAAEQGSTRAQTITGDMYYNGNGVKQSYQSALKWYKKAAENGSSLARTKVGDMYYTGQGQKQSYAEAKKWYLKAAERGYFMPQIKLGDMYYLGKGVTQDYNEAIAWYKKAVKKEKHVKALKKLGDMYSAGQGVQQDYKQAYIWYRLAGRKGDGDSHDKSLEIRKRLTRKQRGDAEIEANKLFR